MNPPFGAQKSNLQADRRFLEKASEISEIIYSIHLKKTLPFLQTMIAALKRKITYQKEYQFPIKWMFPFHSKQKVTYDIILLRIASFQE